MPERILFLDINGVILTPVEGKRWGIDVNPSAIAVLNDIMALSLCHLVISSSWRHTHNEQQMSELLRQWGVLEPRVAGRTGNAGSSREAEIQHWVDVHQPPFWAAVDDAIRDDKNFVHTDFQQGLTEALKPRICKLLGCANLPGGK